MNICEPFFGCSVLHFRNSRGAFCCLQAQGSQPCLVLNSTDPPELQNLKPSAVEGYTLNLGLGFDAAGGWCSSAEN